MKRLALLLPIAALILAFFALGLHQHLTLAAFQESHHAFDAWYGQHPLLVTGGYAAVFILVTLFLPITALMTVVGGALFGFWKGALIASFAAALGATLAFWLSRFVLHDSVQRHFGERLAAVNAGMAKDGAFYLLSLRLIPVIPFFIINLVMGLTPIPTRTFYWVTQLGMLAGILIYVNAGTQLAEVESLSDIFSPGLIGSLVLLGLFPLLARYGLGLIRRRLGHGD
ncbi:VTT domain-containing protein [uncultured Thiodictyon sp.]|uniref:TVP38/TMEM64 family protein n=1 Tax=uncultured Thiodictyon sp. TaxID=1846217 RepID=UPI0025D83874|nr:VTT domain-containing protein [uncultured Thiodictyon sp.]